MNQLLQWLAMGGYAIYVWPAYGLVFVVMIMYLFGIKWQAKRARKLLQLWIKRQ